MCIRDRLTWTDRISIEALKKAGHSVIEIAEQLGVHRSTIYNAVSYTHLITAIINALVEGIPLIIESAGDIIVALIDGIIDAIPLLIAAIPQIIAAIVTGPVSYTHLRSIYEFL